MHTHQLCARISS